MKEFTFKGKTYKVVPDGELAGWSPCNRCVFEHDLDHRCNQEQDMIYTDGGIVQSCSSNDHHYAEV